MQRICSAKLDALDVKKGVRPTRERVIQFGEGGFLRAFVDWMIDKANEEAGMDAGVVLVQPIERGLIDKVNEQDGLYTLMLRGKAEGKVVRDVRAITCVTRGVNPYTDFAQFLALAHNPDMRFIVSNTTEAGIVYTGKDRFDDAPQVSYPGKLTRLLYERYVCMGGAKGTGFIILPVELIDLNGRRLYECVVRTARQWGLEEGFLRWLDTENVFASTLVDRIVTGYPRDDAEEIMKELGYEDALLDTGEPFGLWVIEGPAWIEKELPFKKAGCNVIFTRDVSPYKLRKVRMLNGAHTSMVLGAYLAGLDTVGECMKDGPVRKYIQGALFDEIMPTLDLPRDDLEAFAAAIFERFENPFIRHYLLSIALNSCSKFKARVLPTIREYAAREKKLPKILTFSMAAFIAFYLGVMKEDGTMEGTRPDGAVYPITDDRDVLVFFDGLKDKKSADIAHAVLSNAAFWDEDLTRTLPGFEAAVSAALEQIRTKGARAAIDAVVK